jgi:hypothetical protein
MKTFQYVMLDFNGNTWNVDQPRSKVNLVELLNDGWSPVRETGVGSMSYCYWLDVLEKDTQRS